MKQGMRCVVSGKVQGVWFRAHAKDEADQRSITGYAKNLADGHVEVLAFGDRESLDKMYLWLHQGSPKAVVEKVDREKCPWEEHKDFTIA